MFGADKFLATVLLTVDNHFKTQVAAYAVGVNDSFNVERLTGDGVAEFTAVADIQYLDAVPLRCDFLFPGYNFLGQSIVVGLKSLATLCFGFVEALDIVFNHALHGEVGGDVANRALDILNPFGRVTLGVLGKIQRNDFVFKH